MIDLHSHILPCVDDGAQSLENSLAMAKLAVAQRITHISATPHHMNGKFKNYKSNIIQATNELQKKLDEENIELTIFPGQEVRIHGELIQNIEKDEILFLDEAEQFLLIEFPTMVIPQFSESLFFQMMQKGITPIIVHPERNQEIIENPNLLLEFIDKGALAQVTASSYLGVFGKEIAKISSQLIEANLVHVMASDAHNTRGRSFKMQEAFAKLEKEFGNEKVEYFKQNAKNIVNGELFNVEPPREIRSKKKFFGLF